MTGIIICSRKHSSRVPNKCFKLYNGRTHIEHLIDNLLTTHLPIFLAVPTTDYLFYQEIVNKYKAEYQDVNLFVGHNDDPLARLNDCAFQNDIDHVIRVTHDKMFIDIDQINPMLEGHIKNRLEYSYSSSFIPGTGFEIISTPLLGRAAAKYKNVEHVSYAVKLETERKKDFQTRSQTSEFRLLIDYPEDVEMMSVIFSGLKEKPNLKNVLEFLNENRWVANINKQPLVTFYTCAFNASEWIKQTMNSVVMQNVFKLSEYILIDDASTDDTFLQMVKFKNHYATSIKCLRNETNIGLASSSNLALKHARGKYIIRIDADDYFVTATAVASLLDKITSENNDIIYPDFYQGEYQSNAELVDGKINHHIGGALFNTSALNYIKFTEKLRGHDSLDIYLRAQNKLSIGYYKKPTFFYRQRPNSLSKTNLEERNRIKSELESLHG